MKKYLIYYSLLIFILLPFTIAKATIIPGLCLPTLDGSSSICRSCNYDIKWSDCVDGKQYSSFVKVKECTGDYVPPAYQNCSAPVVYPQCQESSYTYGEWTPCVNGVSVRTAFYDVANNGSCIAHPEFPVTQKNCQIIKSTNETSTLPILLIKNPKIDLTFAKKQVGKILLQIESRGEAWYVNPKDGTMHYMADGNKAYDVMRSLGVGITNKNLERIQINKIFAKKNAGKIFLQVESKGEAYYIDFNGVAHYLKDGAAAYDIMRSLGLGITNENLNKIPEGSL
jgi:hypothetical protein